MADEHLTPNNDPHAAPSGAADQPDGTPSPEASSAPPEGAAGEPATSKKAKKRPFRGPRVFGKWAWAITVPFIIYWAGTMFAGYLENVNDRTRLNQVRARLVEVTDHISKDLETKPTGVRADWERFLNWKQFTHVVEDADHVMKPKDFREVAQPLYSDLRPELKEGVFVVLRERLEEVVLFWEKQEARKHAMDPSGWQFEPVGPGGRSAEEIEASSELSKLLAEDASTKSSYPYFYTGVAIATLVGLIICLPVMLIVPVRISGLSVVVGVVGVVAWIGLVWIDHQFLKLGQWLAPSGRAAFNPLEELRDNPTWRNIFIGVRMFGLSILVPISEEFFLRGWLMRYIDDPDWDEIPIGQAGSMAIYGSVIYGVVAHMGEPLAALAWFGMMTWLFLRTKSIWDCVVAHAVTNFLLGVYVLWMGAWSLW